MSTNFLTFENVGQLRHRNRGSRIKERSLGKGHRLPLGLRAGPTDQDHDPEATDGGEPKEGRHLDGVEKRNEANHRLGRHQVL